MYFFKKFICQIFNEVFWGIFVVNVFKEMFLLGRIVMISFFHSQGRSIEFVVQLIIYRIFKHRKTGFKNPFVFAHSFN